MDAQVRVGEWQSCLVNFLRMFVELMATMNFKQKLTMRPMFAQDLEEYKYTCEPGHMEWTPLNSNLTMQGIKASTLILWI